MELRWGFEKEDLQEYINLGVKDFCNGTDVEIFHWWVKENMSRVIKAIPT